MAIKSQMKEMGYSESAWQIEHYYPNSLFLTDSDMKPFDPRIDEVADALSKNTSLINLFMRGITITNATFVKILTNVSHNKNFQRLDLINATIEDPNEQEIADAIGKTSIVQLDLCLSNITVIQAEKISQKLSEIGKSKITICLWNGEVKKGKIKDY